jgi:hypothetical protein
MIYPNYLSCNNPLKYLMELQDFMRKRFINISVTVPIFFNRALIY